jgi:hypothetical protein
MEDERHIARYPCHSLLLGDLDQNQLLFNGKPNTISICIGLAHLACLTHVPF